MILDLSERNGYQHTIPGSMTTLDRVIDGRESIASREFLLFLLRHHTFHLAACPVATTSYTRCAGIVFSLNSRRYNNLRRQLGEIGRIESRQMSRYAVAFNDFHYHEASLVELLVGESLISNCANRRRQIRTVVPGKSPGTWSCCRSRSHLQPAGRMVHLRCGSIVQSLATWHDMQRQCLSSLLRRSLGRDSAFA